MTDTNVPQTIHILTYPDPKVTWRRSEAMTDAEFETKVVRNLAEYGLNGFYQGWKAHHIPLAEWQNPSQGPRSATLTLLWNLAIDHDIEDTLILAILKWQINHKPCCMCADRTDSPPRGDYMVGQVRADCSRSGRQHIFKGYLCEQCAEHRLLPGYRYLPEPKQRKHKKV